MNQQNIVYCSKAIENDEAFGENVEASGDNVEECVGDIEEYGGDVGEVIDEVSERRRQSQRRVSIQLQHVGDTLVKDYEERKAAKKMIPFISDAIVEIFKMLNNSSVLNLYREYLV
jgi:hypothetical protein